MSKLWLALVMVRDLLITPPVLLVILPLWFLPAGAAYRLARFYGYCGYLVWGEGRRAGMINLRRAYGAEMDYRRARDSVRKIFANLAQGIAEGLQFARRHADAASGWETVYVSEDPELEWRMIKDPRPKVFVGGHLGSWEVAMMMVSLRTGAQGAVVARRVDNPFLNWFVRRVRQQYGAQWIEKRGASDAGLQWLEQGRSVAMLMDENGGWRGMFVDFFGRPASTRKSAALLSLSTGAPIVVGAALRQESDPRFLYKLAVLEPADYRQSADPVQRMTQDIVAIQEKWIRERPLQWRWIHWRWKTRPDRSEERYTRRDLVECFHQKAAPA